MNNKAVVKFTRILLLVAIAAIVIVIIVPLVTDRNHVQRGSVSYIENLMRKTELILEVTKENTGGYPEICDESGILKAGVVKNLFVQYQAGEISDEPVDIFRQKPLYPGERYFKCKDNMSGNYRDEIRKGYLLRCVKTEKHIVLISNGPDGDADYDGKRGMINPEYGYDPTNGARSSGDIFRVIEIKVPPQGGTTN